MVKILCVPDVHIEPENSLTTLSKTGKLLVDREPDYVVQLGDFTSVSSLSQWDMNKRLNMEGRRFEKDMLWTEYGVKSLLAPLRAKQYQQRKQKKKVYAPQFNFLEGNHENRIVRYVEQHPEMQGYMDYFRVIRDQFQDQHLMMADYHSSRLIEGISFCHVPVQRNNQPVSGKYALHRAMDRYITPVVFSHLHRWEYVMDTRFGGNTISALTCGCLFDYELDYSRGAEPTQWRGLTMLNVYDTGKFAVEQIPIEMLYSDY